MAMNLRTLRIERGLSQSDVAAAIGVTTGLIGQIERGDRRGSIETIQKLAVYFGVPMDTIVLSINQLAQPIPEPTL